MSKILTDEEISFLSENFLNTKVISKIDIPLIIDKFFDPNPTNIYIPKNKIFKVVNIIKSENPFHLLGDSGVYEVSLDEFTTYFDDITTVRENKINIVLNERGSNI